MADVQIRTFGARRRAARGARDRAGKPADDDLDRMSPLEIVRAMNAEDATVATAVAAEAPRIADAIAAIAERLRTGGRLIYAGAGTSGGSARSTPLSARRPSASRPTASSAVSPAARSRSIRRRRTSRMTPRLDARTSCASARRVAMDAVVGITASGRTPYVLGAIACAREQGALTIGLAVQPRAPLARAGRDCHRASGRPRGDRRIDTAEGRHRAEDGAEYVEHRRDGAAWARPTAT